ncbi:hypothetical protein V1512DRAFT_266358 [Lipomyces arxii]|uniref:uncharacterized protein n=1 Tax=Lipomyces arxii TaxID=56418 RepID=UPI0034CE986D
MSRILKASVFPLFRSHQFLYHERSAKFADLFDGIKLVPAVFRQTALKKENNGVIVAKSGAADVIKVLARPEIDFSERAIGAIQERIVEDVFTHWNLMHQKSISFKQPGNDDTTSQNIVHEPVLGTLTTASTTSPPLSSQRLDHFFKQMFKRGLIKPRSRTMLWSYEAQKWFLPEQAKVVTATNEPVILKINKKYTVPIGVKYIINVHVDPIDDPIPVSFTRIDHLWSARALYVTVDAETIDELRENYPIFVTHPLHTTMNIPVIFEEGDLTARFLSPSQIMQDYKICIQHGDLPISTIPIFSQLGRYMGQEYRLKGWNRLNMIEKALEILESNPGLNFRTEFKSESVLICPETYDILEERECKVWEMELEPKHRQAVYTAFKLTNTSNLHSVGSVVVGYQQYRVTPQRKRNVYNLPIWQMTRNKIAVSDDWYLADDASELRSTLQVDNQFTQTVSVYSPQFISMLPLLELTETVSYYACSLSRLRTEVLPAEKIRAALEYTPLVAKNLIVLPDVEPVQINDTCYAFQDCRNSLVKFGEDAFRAAIVVNLPTNYDHARIDRLQVLVTSLRLSLHWRIYKIFSHWIGNNRPPTSVYDVDFSKLQLTPFDQYFLQQLQVVIDKVDSHMKNFDPGKAVDLILHFIEHRFYREYLQVVRMEVVQLVANMVIKFDEKKRKFDFWSNERGAVIGWIMLKAVDLLNRLLHPFCPLITDYIYDAMQLYTAHKPSSTDFFPHTAIASSQSVASEGYPVFISTEDDIRYTDPTAGKPVSNDIGYFSPETESFVKDAYLIMKGLQHMRYIATEAAQDGTSASKRKFTISEPVGDVYPEFAFQDKLREIKDQAWGAVCSQKFENPGLYSAAMSHYRNRIARAANITVLDFYGEEPTPGTFDHKMDLGNGISLFLKLAPDS